MLSDRLCLSRSRPLRYGAFFLYYVMQGVPAGFGLTAVTNYLAAQGLKPVQIGAFAAAVGLPWTFQFVWGPVIDRFQASSMGRRRPWVVMSQAMAVAASLGLLLIRDPATQLWATSLAFFAHSVVASIQDASVDAMAIAIIPEAERGRVNAFMRGGMLVGSGLGAASLSMMMNRYGFRAAAIAHSLALLAMMLATGFLRENPGDDLLPWSAANRDRRTRDVGTRTTLGGIFAELFRGLLEPTGLRAFAAIATVYLAASVYIRALNIELIQGRGWSDADLSLLTGTSGIMAALVVVLVGGSLSDRFGHRRMLMVAMSLIAGFLLFFNLASRWWSPRVVGAGLTFWYTFDPLLSVAAMPALMAICRPGVEGSQFTAYMAFVNFCDVVGSVVAGAAMRYFATPGIGLLCGLAVLAALLSIVGESRRRTTKMAASAGDGAAGSVY